MVFTRYFSYSEDIKIDRPFSTFPKTIGEWSGKEEHFDKSVYDMLGVDDSYLATYFNQDGKYIQLYIGYYENQRNGKGIHSPKNCMPGAGWNITESSFEKIELTGNNPREIKVIKLFLEKGSQKQVVFYWYLSNGRTISSEYTQKIYMLIDSIVKHRTDGAFIRLIAPVFDYNENAAVNILSDFTTELVPVLKEYIPS